jgi:DNA polymerase-3 subunit alpha/error-prone DNA polymerase
MYFGTWIDAEGEFFDTAHFADSLQKYPFSGGCYLLLGNVEVELLLLQIKMAKCRSYLTRVIILIPDRQYKAHQQIKEDVSMTHRAPYPQEIIYKA